MAKRKSKVSQKQLNAIRANYVRIANQSKTSKHISAPYPHFRYYKKSTLLCLSINVANKLRQSSELTSGAKVQGQTSMSKFYGIYLMKIFKNVLVLCAWILIGLLIGYMVFVGGKL